MHSLYLAKTMLQRGSVLVSTDISEEMIKQTKAKIESEGSEYLTIKGNQAEIRVEELAPIGDKTFDLEKYLSDKGFSESNRYVLGSLANNESLPFKNATFDCYLANLSLMLVDNYKNMLTEALRVTQPGARFGFTVWGRRDYVKNMTVLNDLFLSFGIKPKSSPSGRTPYDLGKDPEALKAEMETMGYTNIRMWYQKCNYYFEDPDDYVKAMCESN